MLDIKNAYLHAEIDEDVIVRMPKAVAEQMCEVNPKYRDYVDPSTGKLYCKLLKALYGLKQSGKLFQILLSKFLQERGFKQSEYDLGLYFKKEQDGSSTYACVWVDDIKIVGKEHWKLSLISDLKERFKEVKEMDSAGKLDYLGIQYEYSQDGATCELKQPALVSKLINGITKEFDVPYNESIMCIEDHSPLLDQDEASRFRSDLMSLNFLKDRSRPGLTYPIGVLTHYVTSPTELRREQLDRILGYLKRTKDLGLIVRRTSYGDKGIKIIGHTDASFGGEPKGKSRIGGIVYLDNVPVYIRTSRTKIAPTSSTESELCAIFEVLQEMRFLRNVLTELDINHKSVMYNDNKSSIHVGHEGPARKTRSLNAKHWSIKEDIQSGNMELKYVESKSNRSDPLTKAVPKKGFLDWSYFILGISY